MSSPQSPSWWNEVVSELREEPLSRVCQRLRLEPDQVLAALIEGGTSGPINQQPWWPEAVRIAERQGLRRAARLFRTNPRRLRRGLARAGLRIAGQPVSSQALPLSPELRAQLGQQADHLIARAAGLIPQAVAGLRRSLGVPAFRPRPRPRPAVQAEPAAPPPAATESAAPAPVAEAKPIAPAPVSPAPVAPAVPVSNGKPASPELPTRLGALRIPGGGERPRVPPPAPVIPEPTRTPDARVRVWSRSEERPAPSAALDVGSLRQAISRPVVPEEEESEAVAAARALRRSGRVRIVRPDAVDLREPEPREPVRRVIRTRTEPRHGQVRELSPVLVPEVLAEEAAPRPAKPPSFRPGAEPPPRTGTPAWMLPAASSAPAPSAPTPLPSAPAPSAPAPSAPAPSALTPPAKAPPPLAVKPVAEQPVAMQPAAEKPAAEKPAAIARAPISPPIAARQLGWEVRVGDQVLPFLVVAPDIGQASSHILARVGAEGLRGASIRLIGPVLEAL